MPAGGLEPPHPCGLRILSPLRLPFRQAGEGAHATGQGARRANVSSCLLCAPWNSTARNLVCTVKFQGATDHETAAAFAAIEGTVLFHGAHNKHELTFARLAP